MPNYDQEFLSLINAPNMNRMKKKSPNMTIRGVYRPQLAKCECGLNIKKLCVVLKHCLGVKVERDRK